MQANPDKGNLLHTVSGLTKQPLTDSNSVNVAANKPAASQHAGHLSIAGALPDCLFTPAKGTASKPPQGAVSATVDDENTPPHAAVDLVIRPSNGQLMLGSQPAVASTPTSIFRRLNTRSPSGSSTDLASERALTQVSGASTETPSDATCETAANGLKRARPLQRGIHPADINKRITNAQECWHILEIVENFGAGFDAVNVATALHRIAKQRPDDSQKLVASDTFKQLVMMVDIQVLRLKWLPVSFCNPRHTGDMHCRPVHRYFRCHVVADSDCLCFRQVNVSHSR